MTSVQFDWDLPAPFTCHWEIQPDQIDHYDHVNNVAYVAQLERLAWLHSNDLGLSIDTYRSLDRGMAISRHEIDYLASALLGDTLVCATWITACDNKLKLSRHFQFIRASDGLCMLRADTHFVCIALSSGRPKRMPELFASTYSGACIENEQTHAHGTAR